MRKSKISKQNPDTDERVNSKVVYAAYVHNTAVSFSAVASVLLAAIG